MIASSAKASQLTQRDGSGASATDLLTITKITVSKPGEIRQNAYTDHSEQLLGVHMLSVFARGYNRTFLVAAHFDTKFERDMAYPNS